ncbi:hypothetical protein F5X99DRAFT_376604 [Biscogniauxia marginata]|nr:hypothetical protein F5X99DRAFT_376604 [Biscogniauxia marginata]
MDSTKDPSPTLFGRRLIPHVIDEISRNDPQRECLSIPRSSDLNDGWKIVTFTEFANAINYVAHMIIERFGLPATNTVPTIAYIGPNDVRYIIIMIAAIKAGYKAFFISPFNSVDSQIQLLKQTDCHHACFPSSHEERVQLWLQKWPMRVIEAGPVDSWFPDYTVPVIHYTKTFEEAQWLPLVVLHTSGSTGSPNPIVSKQGMVAIGDAYHNLPDWNGLPLFFKAWTTRCKRLFLPLPLFHAAGVYMFLIAAIYWETPMALSLPDRPLSSDLVVDCLNTLNVGGTVLPPVVLEDMSQYDRCVQALAKLEMVAFGGSNLKEHCGNVLVEKGVKLVNAISSTECTPFPTYMPSNAQLWKYLVFNSDLFGAEWRRIENESNASRLVIFRKDIHPGYQGIFYTFPDINEYDTKDLYEPHPTLPNHWLWCGRSDDVIVFSNSRKFNPISMEATIKQSPLVQGAVVIGSNRLQPALLIEPKKHPQSDEEGRELINKIWPIVLSANKEAPSYATISRNLVMLSNPQKPFLLAAKGNIIRGATLKRYEEDIKTLYQMADKIGDTDATHISITSQEALMVSILNIFKMMSPGKTLEPDTDIFSIGIDSIQVINVSRLLRTGIELADVGIDTSFIIPRLIYNYSTPRELSHHIYSSLDHGAVDHDRNIGQDIRAMRTAWERHTSHHRHPKPIPTNQNQTIILTGSTGSLGSYLLDEMIKSPVVKRVICLNRAEDGGKRQQAITAEQRGFSIDFEQKVEFWHANLAKSDLGLPPTTYFRLLENTDRFIHSAWPVDFNLSFGAFEPHIQGVRNIATFASSAHKSVPVVFISSTGVADKWDAGSGIVPEERLEDLNLPNTGYGQSKFIGSLILEDIAKSSGFPATIIRMGQIAGPEGERGCWNRKEWLPSLVASSLHLKALPSHIGCNQVDWTPVNTISRMVLEVSGILLNVAHEDLGGYFHGVNPAVTRWEDLLPAIRGFYGEDRIPDIISLEEWVDRLDKSQAEANSDEFSISRNPATKLVDWYKHLSSAYKSGRKPVVFDMKRTLERSPTMRSTTAVTPSMMESWCKQWGF